MKNWETQIQHVVLKIKAYPIQFTAHKNRISWVYCGFSYKKRKIQTHNKLTLKVMTIKHNKKSPRRLILAAGIYTAAASVHVLIKKKNGKKIINKLLTFFKKKNCSTEICRDGEYQSLFGQIWATWDFPCQWWLTLQRSQTAWTVYIGTQCPF